MLAERRAEGAPEALRRGYLDALPEPQELYVEVRVRAGTTWVLSEGGDEVGYAVLHEGAVVEFHCAAADRLEAAWDALQAAVGPTRILAKSFDAAAMAWGLDRASGWAIAGRLYRTVADPAFDPRPEISVRAAEPDDLAAATAVDPSFFADETVTAELISRGGLFLYQRAGDLLGCGLMDRVIAGRDDIDIGMAVDPVHRGHGLGAYIIAHLKRRCLDGGQRPICGHHVSNIASQRSLERAGFASRHRLVEFRL